MADLKTPWLIWLKASLLLVIGIVSGALLLADAPSWRHTALLLCCVWGFCRAYYFAFHGIEHWLLRFVAGLHSR